MTRPARWFRNVVLAGVAVNLSAAIPGIFWPRRLLALFGAPPVTEGVWPAFAFLLLLLLSLFYIPPALAPMRHRVAACLAVLARLAGVLFFFLLYPDYRLAGFVDLVFAIAEGWLLALVFVESGVARLSSPA
jgi:hypothetical protein